MTECNYAYRFADIHSCVFLRTGFFGVLLFSGAKDHLPEKHKENRQDVVTHYDWNRLRMVGYVFDTKLLRGLSRRVRIGYREIAADYNC